jgi:hypothetical protein
MVLIFSSGMLESHPQGVRGLTSTLKNEVYPKEVDGMSATKERLQFKNHWGSQRNGAHDEPLQPK